MNRMKNDQVRQAFATRFRKALADLGYTASEQKTMRKLFGVSAQAVRKWAEGQSMPSTARMPSVAAVLGVRRAWLQDGEEPIHPDKVKVEEKKSLYSNDDTLNISREEFDLLQHFRRLSAQQQDLVLQLVDQLTKPRT
jgi:transcriptional regulator with XRE-family HTH domain